MTEQPDILVVDDQTGSCRRRTRDLLIRSTMLARSASPGRGGC
jgi:hypothetical protein